MQTCYVYEGGSGFHFMATFWALNPLHDNYYYRILLKTFGF